MIYFAFLKNEDKHRTYLMGTFLRVKWAGSRYKVESAEISWQIFQLDQLEDCGVGINWGGKMLVELMRGRRSVDQFWPVDVQVKWQANMKYSSLFSCLRSEIWSSLHLRHYVSQWEITVFKQEYVSHAQVSIRKWFWR